LILERPFDIREFEFFPKSDFEFRKIRRALPDAFVHDEFTSYQERFRRLLGIDNELALRLLHKTQSAKNLGDLNVFLRDFMLDVPQTFEIADTLVAEFDELNTAQGHPKVSLIIKTRMSQMQRTIDLKSVASMLSRLGVDFS